MPQAPEQRVWLTPKEAAAYARVSLKRLRKFYLEGNLRYTRLDNGQILIKRQWLDEFLESFEVIDEARKQALEIVESLR
jgi:excisionase family DNA binding protein